MRRPDVFKTSMPGFADDSEWSNSNSGSGRAKVFRELRARGLSKRSAAEVAAYCKRWWRTAGHVGLHTALPNSYFDRIGVPRLAR